MGYVILLLLGAFAAGFVCGVLAAVMAALRFGPNEDAQETFEENVSIAYSEQK